MEKKQKSYRFSANHKKCLLKYTILVFEQKRPKSFPLQRKFLWEHGVTQI